MDLVQGCRELRRKLRSVWSRFPKDHQIHRTARGLWQTIVAAGCHQQYTTNPHVQYAAAQFRRATEPLDVIYGSMQIYGLRLGEARGLKAQPTLSQLEQEFGECLVTTKPVLSQLFVHTKQPSPGKKELVGHSTLQCTRCHHHGLST